MLKVDKNALINRIKEVAPQASDKWYDNYATRLINTVDDAFTINVQEWIDHQPLTPVSVGEQEYTIKVVMAMRQDQDFLSALVDLDLYKRHGGAYETRLWRSRR